MLALAYGAADQRVHQRAARLTPRAGACAVNPDDARFFPLARVVLDGRPKPAKGGNMNRCDVTEQIITAKLRKGIKWSEVARALGKSKEWVTAGCLGQMTFTREQAEIVGKL